MKRLVSTISLSHNDWIKYRKMGIGGSDAGAICGLNPYSTAMTVYADKISEEIYEYDNEAMRQGRDLENYVAQRFMEETNLKLRRVNAICVHNKFPFMFANVDRMIVGENIGLECKTTNILNADKWKDNNVPAHYQIQCHHYMAVTGAKAWYIAVVIFGKDFKYVKIDRDEEIIENLIKIESDFWNHYVLKRIMPDPDGSKAADDIINQYFSRAIKESIILQGFTDKLKRRDEITELISKLEKDKNTIDQEIKLAMAEVETAYCGDYQINWRNVSSSRLDVDRIKNERPDIYQNYLKEIQSRRFTVKAA